MRTVAFFFEAAAGAPGTVSPCIVAYGSGSAMALILNYPSNVAQKERKQKDFRCYRCRNYVVCN
jgi:uncharacterized membrane-anchored protein